ncbi:MAG: NAD-dependent epimerase, partial [Betaproteobacteria bacterium]|nr:NAD-dependent epimerase [Betaproteobacteria bacterium]
MLQRGHLAGQDIAQIVLTDQVSAPADLLVDGRITQRT